MDVNLSGRLQLVKYSISIELYINSKKKNDKEKKKKKTICKQKIKPKIKRQKIL